MKAYIERAAVLKSLGYEENRRGDVLPGSTFDIILKEPAAEVVEVRHGRWIDLNAENSTGPLFKCSECSHLHNPNRNDLDLERVELNPLYCDACGARMDKEDEP